MSTFPPYPAYEDSHVEWLGDIPADWQVQRFRTVFRESAEVNGVTPVGVMLSISGYRGVEEKAYDNDGRRRTAEESATYRVVRPGQLAVNTMWLNYGGLGVSDVLGHVSPAYRAYWIHPGFNRRYVHHLMRSSTYIDGYTALLTGIRPNSLQMSRDNLMSLPVLQPPTDVQEEIAAFLDRETAEIDAFIVDQEELIGLLIERRAATISHAVTKGLDPSAPMKDSGVEWLGTIPAHWIAGNIRRFADMRTGHTPSRSRDEYWKDCHIPWFTLADVWQLRAGATYLGDTASQISELGLENSAAELLPPGTVVLSRTASVGFSGIMPRAMATSQDYWNWVCKPDLIPKFLWYQFLAMRPYFGSLVHGSTHKTIYQADAAALKISVPPVDEQGAIVAQLDPEIEELDAAIADAREAIALSRERRAALISAAVTGKIDVRGAA